VLIHHPAGSLSTVFALYKTTVRRHQGPRFVTLPSLPGVQGTMSDTRNSYPNEPIAPGPDRLNASPVPFEPPPFAKTSEYAHHDKLPSHAEPGVIRRASNPIHHNIAPALATPFMQAEGLIHRGMGSARLHVASIANPY
jgi:hypothetical protein